MKKLDFIFLSISFFVPFIIYLNTMAPTTSLWDCGEFIATAVTLGVPHPPGSPFYLIIGNLFSQIPIFSDIGARLNFISVLSSALSILFLYKSMVIIITEWKNSPNNKLQIVQIKISSLIASLTFAFSYSQWYNAVEAEVYSLSIFFTSIIVWLILKWSIHHNEKGNEKYILLISYLIGITTGLHILNLLVIPYITLVIFYKRYYENLSSYNKRVYFFYTIGLTMILFFIIYFIIYMGFPSFAPKWDGGGTLLYLALLLLLVATTIFSISNKKYMMSTICTSFLLIIIGYSTYATIIIRAKQYPSINENQPDDLKGFKKYMNRDQYGGWSITDRSEPIERPDVSSQYKKRWVSDKVVIQDRSIIPAQYHIIKKNKDDLKSKDDYIVIPNKSLIINAIQNSNIGYEGVQGLEIISDSSGNYHFIVTDESSFPKKYILGYSIGTNRDKILLDIKSGISVPGAIIGNEATLKETLNFFFSYQLYEMYIRYFLWQFSGRGNNNMEITNLDGESLDPKDGVDPLRYGIPLALIIGIIGLVYHASTDPKGALSILALFLATGVAIILYLNQYDPQPRERDYSYVGSFFAFSIWIGIGIVYIFDIIHRWLGELSISNFLSLSIVSILFILMPIQMIARDYSVHNRDGNFVAWDYAYNLLNSCDNNAIIFTNGDNDTFPLWYLQEVEGIRKDIRVVNLSLLNTAWYIEQLIKQPAKVPIKFNNLDAMLSNLDSDYSVPYVTLEILKKSENKWNQLSEYIYDLTYSRIKKEKALFNLLSKDNKLDFEQKTNISDKKKFNEKYSRYLLETGKWGSKEAGVPLEWSKAKISLKTLGNYSDEKDIISISINPTFSGSYLKVQDYMVLKIVEDAFATNPIYFAGTVPPKSRVGLDSYLEMEGLVYKLTNNSSSGQSDVKINESKHAYNIKELYRYRNINNKNISLNSDNIRILNNYRLPHIYNYFSNISTNGSVIDPSKQGSIFRSLSMMKNKLPYDRFINNQSYDNSFDIQIANIYGYLKEGLKEYYDKLVESDFKGFSIDSLDKYIAEPLLKSEFESRSIYTRIINKGDSYNPKNINDVALSYYKILNDSQLSIGTYIDLINKHPNQPYGYFGLAQIYFISKNLNKATETFKYITVNFPNHVDGFTGLAEMYLVTSKYNLAIQTLETIKIKFPNNLEAQFLLYEIYQEINNISKAITVLEHIIQQFPSDDRAYISLAKLYYSLVENYKSTNDLQKADSSKNNGLFVLQECIANTGSEGCIETYYQFVNFINQ